MIHKKTGPYEFKNDSTEVPVLKILLEKNYHWLRPTYSIIKIILSHLVKWLLISIVVVLYPVEL